MNPRVRTARILWASMLVATLMFLAAAKLTEHPTEPSVPIMLPALAVAALFTSVMSVVFPALQLKQGLRSMTVQIDEVQDMEAERMFRDLPPTTRALRNPEAALKAAWPRYQTAFILSMALAESTALFGFMLLFLGFPWFPTILFFVASWALMVYHFPSEARLLRAIETAHGLRGNNVSDTGR